MANLTNRKWAVMAVIPLVIVTVGCGGTRALQNRANVAGADTDTTTVVVQGEDLQLQEPPSDEVKEFDENSASTAERAQALADHVTRMEGVEKTSVAITGNTAIVGLELDGTPDDARLIKLKNEVEKEVRRIDGSITHVAVTASPELVRRITNIADSVAGREEDNEGERPSRFEQIIQRLTPAS